MIKVGVISDTHGYLDDGIYEFLSEVDEIWHAGDIGSEELLSILESWKKLRAVYGNIDDYKIRLKLKSKNIFEIYNQKIFITHIGGYPGKYETKLKEELQNEKPNILICGHSHILKIIYDNNYNLLYINPGAAGNKGWHKVITAVRFEFHENDLKNMEIYERKR